MNESTCAQMHQELGLHVRRAAWWTAVTERSPLRLAAWWLEQALLERVEVLLSSALVAAHRREVFRALALGTYCPPAPSDLGALGFDPPRMVSFLRAEVMGRAMAEIRWLATLATIGPPAARFMTGLRPAATPARRW
jgi:hypothetical protein